MAREEKILLELSFKEFHTIGNVCEKHLIEIADSLKKGRGQKYNDGADVFKLVKDVFAPRGSMPGWGLISSYNEFVKRNTPKKSK